MTVEDGEYYAHLHMSVGNEKGEVFGGHLNRAVVSATCEMVITVIDGKVDRVYDEEIGLNVFKFDQMRSYDIIFHVFKQSRKEVNTP